MESVILIGSGGHSKTVSSAIESQNKTISKVYKNDSQYNPNLLKYSKVIISIGNNNVREKMSTLLKHEPAIIIDAQSNIDTNTNIGGGTVVLKGATIQRDTSIGSHCIINTNSSIDHDCNIGNFTHIAPGSTLCGGVIIGNNTFIGAGSVIIPGIVIGNNVIIGAGSVVIRDIPDNKKAYGNPCKYE
tara:strand:- start:4654 stop:5214 length:561 start_codon:yes stop_codon:yes gene_type:complete